ncbi:nitrilase-related carbon-nitrogen hydrolase [Paraburkholderia ginsengisoli]|uniref:Carbon-nitrogen hydrolase n=1 Tax=Paraburkholderia ginsengisoli TaxID=311231 RepID=A0A7T4N9P5_9BURK|nr:nitrilase-related carbon-nitrogen hydrolase [Paraburkholderia ginsengisoli]QQC67824.1 carbon-nitrogen hydrolase [Paraburkholderia ginsengisoli]
MLRVATIPLVSLRDEISRNVTLVTDWLALAAREQIGLAVFPECCLVGGADLATLTRRELEALAEQRDGPAISAVADAVARTGVAAGVGLIERAQDGRLFNSYVICMPDGQRHCHRKLYAFEHPRIGCGDRFTVFDTAWGVRIGILIGADNYLIENVRMIALMGATLLVAPHRRYGMSRANNGRLQAVSTKRGLRGDPARRAASANRSATTSAPTSAGVGGQCDSAGWLRRWLPARAGDNGMFVAFSDGVEFDNDLEHPAETAMILDPSGRILARNIAGSSAIVSAEVDAALTDQSIGRQWLRGRRPDLYGPTTQASNQASKIAGTPSVVRAGSVALSFAVVGRERLMR